MEKEELVFMKKEIKELKIKIQELQENINRNNTNNSNNNNTNNSNIITNNNDDEKKDDLGYGYLQKLKEENPEHYNFIIENT